MKLENFLALTQARLVNAPCVSSFEDISFEALKIKRGDIFFAYDNNDIELAVKNGAYAIVYENDTAIIDKEIAWINVDNLNTTLKRVLRFRMIEKEVIAYACDEIVLKLSLQVATQMNFFTLFGDLKSTFKSLWNIDSKSVVLFCPTLNDKAIFASVKDMPNSNHDLKDTIEIVEQTLFETSFIYNNCFYERQLISPFFIPYLENLLYLYKMLKISYKLKKFTPIDHFEAVFTNKKFEIKNFGASERVLIFEPNTQLVKNQIIFLKQHATWASTIFLIPLSVEIQDSDTNVFVYKSESEIITILKDIAFHFALIVGVDKSILNKPLTDQKQLTFEF